MSNYNKDYSDKHDYFGVPYPELIDFFKNYENKGLVADLGAGQGRNSVPLSLMGYTVHAIDSSEVGLNQIKEKNKEIKILKKDIYKFSSKNYDIILLDSMLHYYKNDIEKEKNLIKNILLNMDSGSILVNAMIYSKAKYFLEIIEEDPNIDIINKKKISTEWNIDYIFCVVKKT